MIVGKMLNVSECMDVKLWCESEEVIVCLTLCVANSFLRIPTQNGIQITEMIIELKKSYLILYFYRRCVLGLIEISLMSVWVLRYRAKYNGFSYFILSDNIKIMRDHRRASAVNGSLGSWAFFCFHCIPPRLLFHFGFIDKKHGIVLEVI